MFQARKQVELFIPPDTKGITDFFNAIPSHHEKVLESDFSQGVDSCEAKIRQIERDIASIIACGQQSYCSPADKTKVDGLIKDLNQKSEALTTVKNNLQNRNKLVESKHLAPSLSVAVEATIPPTGFPLLSPSVFSCSQKLLFPPKPKQGAAVQTIQPKQEAKVAVQVRQPVDIAVEDLLHDISSILKNFDWKHKRQWVLSSDEPPGILEMCGIVNDVKYKSYQHVQQLNDVVSLCEAKIKDHHSYKSPQGYLYFTLSKLRRVPDTQLLDLDKLDQIKKELSERFVINDATSTVSYKKK